MSPLLDLSGADTTEPSFEPLTAGPYEATVMEAGISEASGNGKLAAGTEGLAITFKITDARIDGADRRAWTTYWFPPKDHPKKDQMNGMLVRFLEAVGYDTDTVMSKKFELDTTDIQGRDCIVVLGIESYPSRDIDEEGKPVVKRRNNVRGVKKIGSVDTGAAAGGKGLI